MNGEVSCEHAHECAGCPLIDRPYAAQLDFKRDRVRRAAALYPTLADLVVEPVAPADPRAGYRVRAKLMVGAPRASAGNPAPVVGLFARVAKRSDPHRVVDIPGCRVLSPALARVVSRLRGLLANPPSDAGPCLVAEDAGGRLSAFDLREVVDVTRSVLVTLVLGAGSEPETEQLEAAGRSVRELAPEIAGVAVNYRARGAVQVLGPTTTCIAGTSIAVDRIGSVHRLATHGSFTQVHEAQAARIESWIASKVGDPETTVLDLYGGSGALSLPLARKGARVTLVESFRPAAECAERAAKEQGLEGFAVLGGDAAAILANLSARGARFDVIVTNPPRRGMAPLVRRAVSALLPRLLAYVSCDPETLCRDLDHFARLGYRAEMLRPVDMIPQTDQVETVAFLRREVVPPPCLVFDDGEVVVVDRPAYDPPPVVGGSGRVARWIAGATGTWSGLAVGCRTADVEGALRTTLASPDARTTYLALCRGAMARAGKARRVHYQRIARAGGHSVVRLVSGAAAETRIENDLARLGHPIVGDTRHGHAPTNRHFEEKYALDRPFLHCARIEFNHPRTGARVAVEAPLPGELTMVLERLGLVALDVSKEVVVG